MGKFGVFSILGLGVSGTLACNLVLGLDEGQPCSSDADCLYSSGQGTCVDDVCRPPTEGSTAGTTTTTPTTSGPGTSSGSPPDESSGGGDDESSGSESSGSTAECLVNTDCEQDQRCNGAGACVDLLSAQCQVLQYPDEDDRDNVVFVGTIFPVGEPFTGLVKPIEQAAQLAFEDFNAKTTLQGDRKIAWVGCDSTDGAFAAVTAATHLVDDVGVQAIVGPVFTESVLAVAEDITVPAGVFLLSPTSAATVVNDFEDEGLIWRTNADAIYETHAIADRLVDLTAAPLPTSRVLVLTKEDTASEDGTENLTPLLEDGLAGVEVTYRSYENPILFGADTAAMSASYAAVILDAFGQLPGTYGAPEDHYTDVVLQGTGEAQVLLYNYIGTWAAAAMPLGAPLPRFHVTQGGVADLERMVNEIGVLPGTETMVPLKPLIMASLSGTSANVFDENNFDAFNIRYRIRFNDEDAISASGLSYDAVLSTLFAMSTIPGDEEITGTAIAAAMPRLMDVDGTFVSFSGQNLAFITQARNALVVDGGSVDLQGVSGALQWNARGDIRADVLGYDLLDNGGSAAIQIDRMYVLDDPPAVDGAWTDL